MENVQPEILVWDDVSEAAGELFNIWTSGRDMVWAEEAWGILVAAGLPVYTTEYGRCRAGLYLLGLSCLYYDFCWIGCDEQQIPNYLDAADWLGLTPFRMGQIVATDPDFLDGDFDDGIFYYALEAYAKQQQRVVYGPLFRGYGSTLGFARALWRSVEGEDEEEEVAPLSDWGDWSIPGAQLQVYAWIDDGCYPVG